MIFPGFENSRLDSLSSLYKFHTIVDVLRLDLMHPVISGNKWFKLKEYIKEAGQLGKPNIITWGGAYSNHLVATAAFANAAGFKSAGIVRGEQPARMSSTLTEAASYGMDLFYLSRQEYQKKKVPEELKLKYPQNSRYFINEGGYGDLGARGAEKILSQVATGHYTHIIAAVGTGTTLAGIINAAAANQQIIGISVLKNNLSLHREINNLLPPKKKQGFILLHDYHFGGYAKYTPGLIDFMNEWYTTTGIPSDFVYTAKLFYATKDLITAAYFPVDSRLLLIHSGGLQGNRSLPNGTLIF